MRFSLIPFIPIFLLSSVCVCAKAQDPVVLSGKTMPWTADEKSRMPKVALLQAGTPLALCIVPNAAGVRAGGKWEAEWGKITNKGAYTAPRFMPAMGTDTITYTDPDGRFSVVEVRILPNPHIPGSNQTPYLECPPEILSPQPGNKNKTGRMTPEVEKFYAVSAKHPEKITIVATGTRPAPPQEISAPTRFPLEKEKGSGGFFRLPEENSGRLGISPVAARRTAKRPTLFYARLIPFVTPEILENRLSAAKRAR